METKKLFWLLMPFINRKYFNGRGPKWLIEDANGRSVECFCCGNIANAVGEVKLFGWLFRLPVCKAHIRSYFAGRGVYSFSCTFLMNLKYKPLTYAEWSLMMIEHACSVSGIPRMKFDAAHDGRFTYDSYVKALAKEKPEHNLIFAIPWHNGPILGAGDVCNPPPPGVPKWRYP